MINMHNAIIISVLVCVLLISTWRLFFKKEKVIRTVFPNQWRILLVRKVKFYQNLSAPDRDRFEQAIHFFLGKIKITGIGTAVEDEDRLLVAASAIIPIFGFPTWQYNNLHEVLLYEGEFNEDYQTQAAEDRNILGMVGSGAMNRLMILSKPALHKGFENNRSKSNVGIHEFVHLLDKADGDTDGIPEYLLEKPFILPWIKLIHQEIQAINDNRSEINPYGANNEAEFLSVVSEYFFQQPHLLEKNHPELFQMLERIFRQDLT